MKVEVDAGDIRLILKWVDSPHGHGPDNYLTDDVYQAAQRLRKVIYGKS